METSPRSERVGERSMRRRCRRAVLTVGLLSVQAALGAALMPQRPACGQVRESAVPPELDTQFRDKIVPLLSRYCVGCHGGDRPKGDVNLVRFGSASDVLDDHKLWERVLDQVAGGVMPPPDQETQPSEEEVAELTGWVESALSTGLCEGPAEPGHVTLRRLNRAEYDNTIRDLVGVDFHPASDFPTDDVGYGFDNIGDVLTLSPLLLERYLTAAEQVAARAILTDRTDHGALREWVGRKLEGDGDRLGEEGRILPSAGEARGEAFEAAPGDYSIRVRAYGQQAGDEPARMALRIDGNEVHRFDVNAEEDEPAVYEHRVRLEGARHAIAAAFVNDFYDPTARRRSRRDRNLVVLKIEAQGPIVPGGAPLPDSHRRILFREPADAADVGQVRDCARAVLEAFSSRAYRRPASREEVERLLPPVEQAMGEDHNFARGIQAAMTAILVSPNFLFRVEADPPGTKAGEPRPLNDYELATRLSYFLWSSLPDEELFRLAGEGRLRDQAVLAEQVRRMLGDPKVNTGLVENFAMQWLQLRTLPAFVADKELFPGFDPALREAMLTETRLFFGAVVREDLTLDTFLDADFTFLNERLARHYGIAGIEGEEFRRVALPSDSPRGGLLTQASVLTATSNPTRTSPVKRGKWILEAILGTPPPPPPPNVPQLSEEKQAILSGSLRERLEKHRSDPACASCHDRMDTLGFGFENFDATGAWRDQDASFPIDPSGILPGGSRFTGPAELKRLLGEKRQDFARALTEKMLTYALGRGLEAADRCVIDEVASALEAHDHRFGALVTAIVKSVPFRMTQGQSSEGNAQ